MPLLTSVSFGVPRMSTALGVGAVPLRGRGCLVVMEVRGAAGKQLVAGNGLGIPRKVASE